LMRDFSCSPLNPFDSVDVCLRVQVPCLSSKLQMRPDVRLVQLGPQVRVPTHKCAPSMHPSEHSARFCRDLACMIIPLGVWGEQDAQVSFGVRWSEVIVMRVLLTESNIVYLWFGFVFPTCITLHLSKFNRISHVSDHSTIESMSCCSLMKSLSSLICIFFG
jgi:hypothetical protein